MLVLFLLLTRFGSFILLEDEHKSLWFMYVRSKEFEVSKCSEDTFYRVPAHPYTRALPCVLDFPGDASQRRRRAIKRQYEPSGRQLDAKVSYVITTKIGCF